MEVTRVLPFTRQVGQKLAAVASSFAESYGFACTAVHKRIPELSHFMGDMKMVRPHIGSGRDPIHEQAHSRATFSSKVVFPERTQRGFEDREHPNQVGML